MPDYIIRKREKQRAIERWENEGGRCARADSVRAHERERHDHRASHEGTTKRLSEIEA